jgi:hypothetical protein
MVCGMAEENVYLVMLVLREPRGVEVTFLFRGQLPEEGQEIDVEDEFKPDDRRRARVTRVTEDHEPLVQGPLIHAIEIEP